VRANVEATFLFVVPDPPTLAVPADICWVESCVTFSRVQATGCSEGERLMFSPCQTLSKRAAPGPHLYLTHHRKACCDREGAF
jgi:hypothetical protein